MTVSSTTNKSGPYLGNGSTVDFDYEFRILDPSHLTVIMTENGVDTPVAPSDFTVSGVGASGGGALTFLVAPATGQSITIIRNAPFTQPTDLENQGAYYAETVEGALDLGVMRDQQLAEGLSRAVQIPIGADPSALGGLIEDIIRLGDSADEIDTVAGIAAQVSTVAGISANVTTVAGIAANVTTVAGIAANVTTVAGIAADVSTAAANIAAIVAAPAHAAAAIAAEAGAETAQAAAEAAAASLNMPAIQPGDVGKKLAVNATEDGYDLVADGIGASSVDMTALIASPLVPVGTKLSLQQYSTVKPNIGGGTFVAVTAGGFYGLPVIPAGGAGNGYTDSATGHVVNLTGGGGGAGATVTAIVEGGKVTGVLQGLPGSGYTSTPSFNWADVPGGGTPGTITFTGRDDGGAYVYTTAGNLLVREELLEAGIIRPEWWGAVGDQTGNDAPAFNKMFDFIRTTAVFSAGYNYKVSLRGRARYSITSGINATKIRARSLVVENNGALFHLRFAGTGLDFTNSRNIKWPNLTIYGDATTKPVYGFVVASQFGESSAWNDFSDAEIYGWFTSRCHLNVGSEFCTYDRGSMTNNESGAEAFALDSNNALGWNSAFAPTTIAANTWLPMTEISFRQFRWATTGGADGGRIYGPISRLRFEQAYNASRDGAALGIYQRIVVTGAIEAYDACVFDIRGEPRASVDANPIESMLTFYTASGVIAMRDVTIRDYGMDYEVAVLEVLGTGGLTMRGLQAHIGSATNGGASAKFLSNVSAGTVVLDGQVNLYGTYANQGDLSGITTMLGSFRTRIAEGSITWPTNYSLTVHFADNAPKRKDNIFQKTVAWDAPSIASGAQASTTLTVTGAAIGDFVHVSNSTVLLSGLHLWGEVTAADTVTIFLSNLTGAAVDKSNSTYNVRVDKR